MSGTRKNRYFHPWLVVSHYSPRLCAGMKLTIQAFIQALLSTAVFSQRLSFIAVCLVQWLGHQRENL